MAAPNIDRIFLHNPGTNDTFGAEDLDAKTIEQLRKDGYVRVRVNKEIVDLEDAPTLEKNKRFI